MIIYRGIIWLLFESATCLGSSEVGRVSWGSCPACLERLLGHALIGELYLFIICFFILLFIERSSRSGCAKARWLHKCSPDEYPCVVISIAPSPRLSLFIKNKACRHRRSPIFDSSPNEAPNSIRHPAPGLGLI